MVAADTGMPVYRADSPLTCVAVGSGQALDHLDQLSVTRQLGRPPITPDWRTA
jgi:actin-like ATPase involved in cell morphogenesis